MSDTEIVALVITAALGGVGTGLGIATTVMLKRADRATASFKVIDAYAAWLAARKCFTRCCWSLVVAKRRLRTSEPMSPVAAGRRADVDRILAEWRQTASDLDTAEAALIAWSPDLSTADTITKHPRCWDCDIQLAADAHSSEVQDHHEGLVERDRLAAEALRPGAPGATSSAAKLATRVAKRGLAWLDDLAARWARR